MRLTLASASLLACFVLHVQGKASFSDTCQPMDGQFYGEDNVGFYCMTESRAFDYSYSM